MLDQMSVVTDAVAQGPVVPGVFVVGDVLGHGAAEEPRTVTRTGEIHTPYYLKLWDGREAQDVEYWDEAAFLSLGREFARGERVQVAVKLRGYKDRVFISGIVPRKAA